MKNASVLVTGAAGFIGSHLVERLHARGTKVTAFVHYNSRNDHGFLTNLPFSQVFFHQQLTPAETAGPAQLKGHRRRPLS